MKDLFEKTIQKALSLKLGLDIYEYTIDDRISNYRDFEAELDINYPIKGTEINFSSEIFSKWSSTSDNYTIVNDEKGIASEDITSELSGEPFRHKEMTFVYLFTMLEDFGNSLVEKVNNAYYIEKIQDNGSWHSRISKHAKNSKKDLVQFFAAPFNLQRSEIDKKFVDLFFKMKDKRNSIIHELEYTEIRNFSADVQSLLILICYLYHINDKSKSPIKYYPWYDYNRDDD